MAGGPNPLRDEFASVPKLSDRISSSLTQMYVPRLLVSVRSALEARSALSAEVDILDVKEPARGSLGMATTDQIFEIAALPEIVRGQVPLSVALGEVIDWPIGVPIPKIPEVVTYAKLGLSQCDHHSNWIADWSRVRYEVNRQTGSQLQWVAVAYADYTDANCPPIAEILASAIDTECVGFLIDTWTKDGRVLIDLIDPDTLANFAERCHNAGLFFAIAGRLRGEDLPKMAEVRADILAIRSAACRHHNRTAEVDSELILKFKKQMALTADNGKRR